MCNSEGKKQTEGFYVKSKSDNSFEGKWPDGKTWKIEKQNTKFISPKFDSYSCVTK